MAQSGGNANRAPLRQTIRDSFVETVSIVGPLRFSFPSNLIWQSIWVALFLAALAVTIYQVYLAAALYAEYPYNVLIEIKSNNSLPFPAVTVCNLNAYRRQAVKEIYPALYETIKAAQNEIARGEYGDDPTFNPYNGKPRPRR